MFKMNRIIYLASLIVSAAACHTREEALDCFYKRGDYNHDGRISRHELVRVIDEYLPWYKRIPFKTFGGINRVMTDCDENGDLYLTKLEAENLKHSCLDTCFKRDSTIETFKC